MKNGKKLTLKQKLLLKSKGLSPSEWLRVKEVSYYTVFINRFTGEVKKYPKGVYESETKDS